MAAINSNESVEFCDLTGLVIMNKKSRCKVIKSCFKVYFLMRLMMSSDSVKRFSCKGFEIFSELQGHIQILQENEENTHANVLRIT